MSVPYDVRLSLFKEHGNFALAYSATHQPGLDHFGDERGFLAHKMIGHTALILSDPIAPFENRSELIHRFIREKKDICFLQISRPIAEIASCLGFFVNEMGTETKLEFSSYSTKGSTKRNFRTALNRMRAAGTFIAERSAASIDKGEIAAVSDGWRRSRPNKKSELAFLVRPIVFGDELDVRKFWTFDRNGKLVAFAFFDPVYDRGVVVGYLNSVRRRLAQADSQVSYALMYSAIEKFRSEGRKWLSVGLSPFEAIEDKEFAHSWFVRRAFRAVYTNALFNRYFYPLQGLARHKRSYCGIPYQTYFAFNIAPSFPRLIKILQATKLI